MKKTILFQGDSITDAARSKDSDVYLGVGYARMVEAQLGFEEKDKFTFINRGVNGNRIIDLYARIKRDIIHVKPDYMSILIGVNDVWHEIGGKDGISAEKYEKLYTMMIDEIKAELPDTKIMILLPYVLEGAATCNDAEHPDRFDLFSSEVKKRAEAAKRVAERFNLPYVDLQQAFDSACDTVAPSYWATDGVHPTAMGHELIKREWIKCFNKIR